VIIAGAGGAAHLPGMIAAHTHLPVLGVPIESASLNARTRSRAMFRARRRRRDGATRGGFVRVAWAFVWSSSFVRRNVASRRMARTRRARSLSPQTQT